MDEIIKALPQWLLVFIILCVGVLIFYLAMPPHTACDSQLDVFKKSQTPFLFLDEKKSYVSTVGFTKSVETCKKGNGHGSCRELFDGLSRIMLDLKVVPDKCLQQIAEVDQIKGAVWVSLDLFTRIAWGETAPASSFERTNWFDSSHLRTYCALKRLSTDLYGEESWSPFVQSTLQKLPQYNQLTPQEAWPRTLLSLNCDSYR